jgi:RNA polymerase-binding transcription factor DksA
MDGTCHLPMYESHDWLRARCATLRDRVRRMQLKLRRPGEPPPRDASDAANVRENDRILRYIEASARRELEEVERTLARLASGRE